MELFDIKDNKFILNPTNLYLPPFRQIWERDKSKGKEQAYKEIAYVTFLCNFSKENPYGAYIESERENKIKQDIIGDINWEPDELVKEAVDKYREMQSTANSRLLVSAKKAADKLAIYFDNFDPEARDKNGRALYPISEVRAGLKDLSDIVRSLDKLQKQVQAEQLEAQEARGGSQIGAYEIPNNE